MMLRGGNKLAQSRIANSVRNIFWAFLNKIVIMLLPFVVRSVMIYKLGVEYTGLSNLFTSILAVLSLAELGFSNAMTYCMYEPIHKDDKVTISAMLNLYRKIYSVIGIVILTGGLVLLPFLPKLINGQIPENINIYILYLIYLFNTVISYFMFAYKSSLLTAYQRNDLISIIGLMVHICLYLVQICVLFITANFYLYAILLPASTLAINLGYNIMTKKLYPDITCTGQVGADLKKQIKKRVIGVMLYKFSSTTRTSLDSVVISAFLGLFVLTQYQNYYLIISSVFGILAMINNAVTASVGDSIVAKEIDENYKDFKKFNFIYMLIASWCTICILCLIQPFMQLWMGKKLMLTGTMAVLFSVYFYAQVIGDIVFVYRTAAGLWWQDRIRPVVEAVLNVLLNILLVKIWGIYGVIIATIITLCGVNFLWGGKILFKHYFKKSMSEYLVMQVKQTLITTIVACVTFIICQMFGDGGIISFLCKGIICVIVPPIIFWLFYRKSVAFTEAKMFIKNTISIIRKVRK